MNAIDVMIQEHQRRTAAEVAEKARPVISPQVEREFQQEGEA